MTQLGPLWVMLILGIYVFRSGRRRLANQATSKVGMVTGSFLIWLAFAWLLGAELGLHHELEVIITSFVLGGLTIFALLQ